MKGTTKLTRRKLWAAGAALVLLVAIGSAAMLRRVEKPLNATSFLMNTVVEYSLYGKNAAAAQAAVEQTLRDLENKTSMYITDSEIGQLNANAGGDFVSLSEESFALLARSAGYGSQSDGVFDVTIAPLTALWNVTAESPQIPAQAEIDALRTLVDYRDIQLSAEKSPALSARLARKGQAVDVGGIAKGFACDLARRAATENGVTSGYLSIGGNIMVIGAKPDGAPFRFGVRDPRGGVNDYVGVVSLPDSTMATSGDYERFFEQDGVRYHHILDPSTGYPAQSDLLSVSVVTPDGALADYLSTYLFIKGRDFALAHLDDLNCGLILIDKDKNIYTSQSLRDSFAFTDKSGNYRFVAG